MIESRWQKVLVDLWRNRSRTLVVALAIAVGVYAVGVVVNARTILVREYDSDQAGALPASAIVYTHPFDEALARRIADIPGIAAAEGRSQARARVYRSDGQPRDLVLVAVPDLANMQVDALTPLEGAWPPGRREIILERMSSGYLGVGLGDVLTFELDDGSVKSLLIGGTAHDAQHPSPGATGTAWGYVSLETYQSLGFAALLTELRIRVSEDRGDRAHIQSIVDQVEAHLRRTGRPLLSHSIITESLAKPFISAVVLILTAFGAIILLLSGFLVVNAMAALITQQIPQIGVMKLIGARRLQIMGLYLATVLVYGVLAVSVATPLSLLTARLIMTAMINQILNVMPESYAVPPALLAVQVVIGLLLPLASGLAPVVRGTRITTQGALSEAGLGGSGFGQGVLERVLARLQNLWSIKRPVLLSLRNTVRHKGRLLQTLVVLTLGTALFISVVSVRESVSATLDGFMRFHRYDVSVDLAGPERAQRLEEVGIQVPGVIEAQVWSVDRAIRKRPDGTRSELYLLYAIPEGSDYVDPEVLAGRWLRQPDSGAAASGAGGRPSGTARGLPPVVVNSEAMDEEPDLKIGSEITVEIAGRETLWRVAGEVSTESRGPVLYVNHGDYAYAARTPGQGTRLVARTQRHDADSQHQVALELFAALQSRGTEVTGTETSQVVREENSLLFTIVVAFLILMALLLAAVGGLGLATTMSINVIERVREIGVLRAIGASSASVRRIVLWEGVSMGLLSWVLGALLSLPLSPFLSDRLGVALIQMPLTYQYSWAAAAAWFVALQVIALVASLGPARNAVRLTVREVLAYE